MHHMAEKREVESDILPGFHRKKSEFEFKLLYYNQKRRALSSSFFQSPGPDNIFSHQAVHCHDDHIHQHWNGLRGSRTVQASDAIFCFCRSLCLICVISRNFLMSKPDISVRNFVIVMAVIAGNVDIGFRLLCRCQLSGHRICHSPETSRSDILRMSHFWLFLRLSCFFIEDSRLSS